MELTEIIIQNAQETERKLLTLSTFIWHQLAFEDTQKEDWEESKNVRWTAWRDEVENG